MRNDFQIFIRIKHGPPKSGDLAHLTNEFLTLVKDSGLIFLGNEYLPIKKMVLQNLVQPTTTFFFFFFRKSN